MASFIAFIAILTSKQFIAAAFADSCNSTCFTGIEKQIDDLNSNLESDNIVHVANIHNLFKTELEMVMFHLASKICLSSNTRYDVDILVRKVTIKTTFHSKVAQLPTTIRNVFKELNNTSTHTCPNGTTLSSEKKNDSLTTPKRCDDGCLTTILKGGALYIVSDQALEFTITNTIENPIVKLSAKIKNGKAQISHVQSRRVESNVPRWFAFKTSSTCTVENRNSGVENVCNCLVDNLLQKSVLDMLFASIIACQANGHDLASLRDAMYCVI